MNLSAAESTPRTGLIVNRRSGCTALLLAVLFVAAGCASGPARKPAVLPPMPPGFKHGVPASAGQRSAFAPASAEPTVAPGTGILQAPEIYVDPDPAWPRMFLARAYQGPNTVLTVEWAHSPAGPWQLVTEWACWGSEQIILVSTSGQLGQVYMRGRHTPCTPGFAPASAARLSFTKDFTTRAGRTKAARIEGHDVADGFTLWKVLP